MARPIKVGYHIPEVERQVGWQDILELVTTAEDVGFDSVWVPDHLLYRFEQEPAVTPWECWTLLSAIAAATKRVELGPLVLCTAFRNPAMIAKMAATIDEISGGRFVLGLGAGWHKPSSTRMGFRSITARAASTKRSPSSAHSFAKAKSTSPVSTIRRATAN